jgi:predicted enzyme related to lactoylglutathione lyase
MPSSPARRCRQSGQSIFASADIDADVARVRTLGGQVYFEPMTVGDSGRMAICADPTGAAFGLWQAINHIGAAVENEHGGMVVV